MQNAPNHKNCVQQNANQQVHVNIKKEVVTCYSFFIKDPLITNLFIYNFYELVNKLQLL